MPSERAQRQIDALLDAAEAAIKRSEWALVRERARQVLTLDPDNADGRFYLDAAERGLASGGGGSFAAGSPAPAPPRGSGAGLNVLPAGA